MNQSTLEYLDAYIEQLNGVTRQQQVYGTLSDWHVQTREALVHAVDDLNTWLSLTGPMLLQAHVATTAIGRLDGEIVIISANPGYSAAKNALEDTYRSHSMGTNADFCRRFFAEYRNVCGGSSPYWTRVMRFLDIYQSRGYQADPRLLWARTSDSDVLGGLDLLPFHSTKDGVTPHLCGPNTKAKLREVAAASLAMALRLAPKFLLVTSRPGHDLMCDLMEHRQASNPLRTAIIEPIVLPEPLVKNAPYHLIRAWKVCMRPEASTMIVSIPYQIFSGALRAARVGYSHLHFAAILRTL